MPIVIGLMNTVIIPVEILNLTIHTLGEPVVYQAAACGSDGVTTLQKHGLRY